MAQLEKQIKALIDEAHSQGIDIIYWLKTQKTHEKLENPVGAAQSILFAQTESSGRI